MSSHSEKPIKIAIVGDIHDQWEKEDNLALNHLGVGLVLFVGDFGNEAVEIVRQIAELDLPKAVIFGNHDAWYTASAWGRQQCPYDRTQEDRVQQQIDLLGETQVGYGKLDFPGLQLSVVGSRPFSWGGADWKNKGFLRDRFGVRNFEESTAKIVAEAKKTVYETIIFLGHNAPTGLGNEPEAICGRDWQPLGGDHGDPDFADAIAQVRNGGKNIPLVTFGHMHHRLRHTKARLRTPIHIDSSGTVYLNAASVPRILEKEGDHLRNFVLVSLQKAIVWEISLIWVGKDFSIVAEECFYRRSESLLETVARSTTPTRFR